MKEILKSLKENQTPQTILQSLETTRELGQKRKLKDLKSGERKGSKDEEENYLDEVISDESESESESEEENEMNEEKKEEEDKPVNIFQMKVYENTKKVKTEELSTKRKTLDEIEEETNRKIFKEEREANLTVNPFKDYKKKINEEVDDGKDGDPKGPENFHDIFDEELRQFNQGISSKFNQEINRSEENRKTREKLPIFLREADIMEAINNNLITIISGETGSGIILVKEGFFNIM